MIAQVIKQLIAASWQGGKQPLCLFTVTSIYTEAGNVDAKFIGVMQPIYRGFVPDHITKLPKSGDLCGNITEFGMAEDHLSPRLFCFYILLFNGLCHFKVRYMR